MGAQPAVEILVLYYSRSGATAELARQVCRGVEAVAGAAARLRTVPPVVTESDGPARPVPAEGPPYATLEDLREAMAWCSAARRASATWRRRSSISSTALRACGSTGALAGKPAGVFTSTQTMHGGQETTLLSMMLPLLHHGMYLVGLPYTERALNETAQRRHSLWRLARRPRGARRHADRRGADAWRRRSAGALRRSRYSSGSAGAPCARSTSRMNGTVRRRCAASAASSSVSSSS